MLRLSAMSSIPLELKTKKTEHARLFRLAVACAALNKNEAAPVPLTGYAPPHSVVGQRVSLHASTISKAMQLINAGSQATIASRVLTSKVSPVAPPLVRFLPPSSSDDFARVRIMS